jgi:glucose/arabinose dehydrogenase
MIATFGGMSLIMPPIFSPAAARRFSRRVALFASLACGSVACSEAALLPVSAGYGPNPELPAPVSSLIPTTRVARAIGWPTGVTPIGTPGTTVNAFAQGLQHPRFLYTLPNGDVLAVETNAPPKPDDARGIKGWFFRYFQKRGGGAAASANRIVLLHDDNGDGVADTRTVFLSGLNAPFGVTLVGHDLYVANSDAVMRYEYTEGTRAITSPGVMLVALPAGTINHHWTKTIAASPDGATLFVSIGSNSNAAENGMDKEVDRAMIWAVNRATGAHRVYASGLRNAAGLAIEPSTGALWAAVNERDELGSDLVPDYMTAVHEGAFYGWPYSYFGSHVDTRVSPPRPDLVATAVVPDYALGAHTASIGLLFSRGNTISGTGEGMFVAQHGSWNRNPRSGYKVIFVPFANGRPNGPPQDVLTGFLTSDKTAMGRPVGLTLDASGALLVADDVGNTIWRIAPASARR